MSAGQRREAHRAWKRLGTWFDDRVNGPGSRDREPDPLDALGDVGQVRRLLDEVELRAVRSARLRDRSWAEIATRLGVSRQSAWERWRDLDGEEGRPTTGTPDRPDKPDLRASEATRLRRSSTIVVPNVLGSPVGSALQLLTGRGLTPVPADPDGPTLTDLDVPGAVVTDQSPESGASVPRGSRVTLWTDRGEGGVREPRHPRPQPLTARKYLPEPIDEVDAVG